MGKQAAHGAIWLIDNIVSVVMIVMVLMLLSFGLYAIWDTNTVIASASSVQYEVYKPNTEEGQKTFAELTAMNSDVLGWLTVYGTNIDYPLVQTDNNNTYLTTSAEGEYSLSGAIFLDYRNDGAFEDFNTIIYGHHMDQDAMFGDVSDFKDKAFFDSHEYGNLHYENKDYGIEFFAFIEADAYDSTLYAPGLQETEMQENYLAAIDKDAMYTRDIDVKAGNRIMLLSTCTSDITNGRHLLVGKITNATYEDAFAEVDEPTEQQTISTDKEKQIWDIVPLWLLITIVAVLTIFVIVLIYKMRHFQSKHAGNEKQRRYKK